jgi:hypothetical protein
LEQKGSLMKSSERHVDENFASEFLGLKVKTLQDRRLRKLPPSYCKFGRAVRYSLAELERYADKCKVQIIA